MTSIVSDSKQETICEKARRIERERRAKEEAERMAECKALWDSLSIEPPKLDDQRRFELCGYHWQLHFRATFYDYSTGGLINSPSFHPVDTYKGHYIHRTNVVSFESFGRALINLDESLAHLKRRYPDTLMGNLKAWWERP